MENCSDLISADVIFDCADKPIKGLDGGRAVIINIDDIDRAASTEVGATISDLVLKASKTGFKAEWFKELGSITSAFAPSTEDVDGFTHNFMCRIPTSTTESAERARELANGRYVVVVETRYKGVDQKSAFKVMGWVNGLRLSEMTYDTKENSGSLVYTATTIEGYVENYPFNIFLETDYATSKATFDSLFATA